MDNNSGPLGPGPAGTRAPAVLPAAITGWIRAGAIDAELGSLVSILIEHGLPLVVAAPTSSRASGWAGAEVRDAFGRALLEGGRPSSPTRRTGAPVTVDAASLESVLARMPLLSLESVDDAGARVAIVSILGPDEMDDTWRVVAAHLLRPPLRDGHGHIQRQGPAVLATWDPGLRRFEHFSWAVLPELAILVEHRAGDLESEIAERADLLAGLAAQQVDAPAAVRLAIEAAGVAAETTAQRH